MKNFRNEFIEAIKMASKRPQRLTDAVNHNVRVVDVTLTDGSSDIDSLDIRLKKISTGAEWLLRYSPHKSHIDVYFRNEVKIDITTISEYILVEWPTPLNVYGIAKELSPTTRAILYRLFGEIESLPEMEEIAECYTQKCVTF